MRSSTIWATAWELTGKKMYFHTQYNRRVRMVDCSKLNYTKEEIGHIALDEKKHQDVKK